MHEAGITKHKAISLLTRSPHGALEEYVEVGRPFAAQDPEFFAHLVAWNAQKGSVRDAKTALPVIALGSGANGAFAENALAHLALLDPRNLARAARFARTVKTPGHGRAVARLVERYLREREAVPPWWHRTALQHRAAMKELYALFHVRPGAEADLVLFKGQAPAGTVFEVVRELPVMPAPEAAVAIVKHRIPWLIAQGALGARAKDPELLFALIGAMSPAELVTNTATLERWGVRSTPELRGAFEAALEKAASSKTAPPLKATRAAAAQKDKRTADKLGGLQERQLAASEGIEGDWLVLGDKSASMAQAIEAARHVAATLAKLVRGRVTLVFFDTAPRALDVTGKTYEEILALTGAVRADGGTSIGCGLAYARERGLPAQGIALVSDAQENTPPFFAPEWGKWRDAFGMEPPVYLYRLTPGMQGWQDKDVATACAAEGIDVQEFDLTGGRVDYYSIPNIVSTMRVSRYALLDEIMDTPLLTVDAAFAAGRRH